MTALLTCENMTCGYGTVAVVRDVSFSVNAGEVVALLGPNGAGKTTTLLACSGLIPAMKGQLNFDGKKVSFGQPDRLARAGLSLVPDDRSLFTNLSVRQNLELGRGRDGASVDEMIKMFPALRPRLSMRAGLLSGGEQQMLTMGRALAGRPRLLLIDEMSMGLAPIIVEELLQTVRRLADEHDVGVLLVEQHVHNALEIADRALLMVHGSIAFDGLAADLLKDADRLEQGYLGARGSEAGSAQHG
jgi:branched-chain amino acid transport system ATP-binding protein